MKKLSILLGICIWAILGACSQNEDENKQHNDELPLQVFPNINDPFSRTTITNEGNYIFSANDQIGLFAVNSGVTPSSSDEVYNQPYTYDGSAWSTSTPIYWPAGDLGSVCKLYSYYPYSSSITDFNRHVFTVGSDQSSQDKIFKSDFLYGKDIVNKQSNPVSLRMKHLFSLLTVNVKYENSIDDICSALSVNAQSTGIINLEEGTAIGSGSTNDITPAKWENAKDGFAKSYSLIIPPQTLSNHPLLTFTLDNTQELVNITKTFEQGKRYTINFTITNKNEVTFDGIYVAQWDDQVELSGGVVSKLEVLQTGDVIEYQKKRTTNPVTLVVLGDGFTQEHLMRNGLFEQSATKAIEFMFNVEPFKTYRDYFNIYFIAAESNEAGADNTSTGEMKDTYFGAGWNDSYSDMAADYNTIFSFVQKYCPDLKSRKTDIDHTAVFLLVNDPRYGGMCWTWSSGRSYMICPLTDRPLAWQGAQPEITGTSTGDWRNTFLHEGGGHCFGKLTDEYYYGENRYPNTTIAQHFWSVPFGKNVIADKSSTSTSNYWKHMVNDRQFPKVGYYEGAMQYGKGIWRSEIISCMIDNRRYYNAYSRQLLVERIKSLAGETFDYNDFLSKDVNYDEILDGNGRSQSGIYGKNFAPSDIKIYPPLPSPKLIDTE